MSSRDISAFIGHVVMAMRFVADFIDGMTLDDFLADECPSYCASLSALPECPPLPDNLDDFP